MGVSTVEWLSNFGATGVVLVLILTGLLVPGFIYKKKEEENEQLRATLQVERQRNADLQEFAQAGAKAMSALVQVAEEHRQPSRSVEVSGDSLRRVPAPDTGGV